MAGGDIEKFCAPVLAGRHGDADDGTDADGSTGADDSTDSPGSPDKEDSHGSKSPGKSGSGSRPWSGSRRLIADQFTVDGPSGHDERAYCGEEGMDRPGEMGQGFKNEMKGQGANSTPQILCHRIA